MRGLRIVGHLTAVIGITCGGGCAELRWWQRTDSAVPPIVAPTPPLATGSQPVIQPAGGVVSSAVAATTTPTTSTAMLWPSLGRKLGRDRLSHQPVAEIATAWRNKIEYLPNPAAQGTMVPGLAGQVFLYTADARPAAANGTLTIDLFDETPRPPGVPPLTPERWEFKKDVLNALRTVDERFGDCYVVFLPWPTYRPDVTRVRLRVRYDPDNGSYPIFAAETRLILTASGGASDVPGPAAGGGTSPNEPGRGVFRFGGGAVSPHELSEIPTVGDYRSPLPKDSGAGTTTGQTTTGQTATGRTTTGQTASGPPALGQPATNQAAPAQPALPQPSLGPSTSRQPAAVRPGAAPSGYRVTEIVPRGAQ